MSSPKSRSVRRTVLHSPLAAAAGTLPAVARAQSSSGEGWPSRPIRLSVGFSAGGNLDIMARLLARHVSPLVGQPIEVENQVGAVGLAATETVSRSPPDGYTWLLLPSAHASLAATMRRLPIDPLDGLTWIGMLTTYPLVLAVAPDSPLRTPRDLVDRARKSPGRLSFSSVGIGSAHHLIGEWINAEAGIEIVHVPCKSSAAAFADVSRGRIDVMVETAPAALPWIRAGRLRALGVTSAPGQSPEAGVPELAATIPGLQYESWAGIAMPPGVPAAVAARAGEAIRKALSHPEVVRQLENMGGRIEAASGDAFRRRVVADIAHYRRIVAARGIRPG